MDIRQQFHILEPAARGIHVRLQQTYARALAARQHPQVIQELLGELLAAVPLMAATVKFQGNIIVQLQSDGPIKLLVAESNAQQGVRAYARWQETASILSLPIAPPLEELLPGGVMTITIDPGGGFNRYQGMVELHNTIALSLEHYFFQSEQLPTKFMLAADPKNTTCAGLMLQAIPGSDHD